MFQPIKRSVAALSALCLVLTAATPVRPDRNEKAFYADPTLVAFVRPGLVIKITSAQIAQDGAMQVAFMLTDPKGAR